MKKLTILIAAIALVCFAVPAMAVDWNFYGSSRMSTIYISDDYGDNTPRYTAGGDDKDARLNWTLQGNSRFGARVKAENLKARFEYGTGVNVRLLWGEWDFGAGKLLVGQDYSPTSQFISTSIWGNIAEDANILGTGTFYGSRNPQLKLSFGGFQVALIENNNGDDLGSGGDVDILLPKLEVGWGMAFDTWSFDLMGGAQTYEIQDVTTLSGGTDDITVTSYVLGGKGAVSFGPATLKAAASYGQNAGNAWWADGSLGAGAYDGDDDINDNDAWQAAFVAVFSVSDMLAFEGGVGYRVDDLDKAKDDKEMQVYVQAFITLSPGVYVLPEIGYIDHYNTNAGVDDGSSFYGGAKWQIDF
jgi:hypothetical protein